jgi:hypothetical protein
MTKCVLGQKFYGKVPMKLISGGKIFNDEMPGAECPRKDTREIDIIK